MNTISILLLVTAITSITAMLSSTSAFAVPNNAQDNRNNPTFPGCGVGTLPFCPSGQAIDNTDRNCNRFDEDEVGNGRNLPAQCYPSP
jgi:hypothetical protein